MSAMSSLPRNTKPWSTSGSTIHGVGTEEDNDEDENNPWRGCGALNGSSTVVVVGGGLVSSKKWRRGGWSTAKKNVWSAEWQQYGGGGWGGWSAAENGGVEAGRQQRRMCGAGRQQGEGIVGVGVVVGWLRAVSCGCGAVTGWLQVVTGGYRVEGLAVAAGQREGKAGGGCWGWRLAGCNEGGGRPTGWTVGGRRLQGRGEGAGWLL